MHVRLVPQTNGSRGTVLAITSGKGGTGKTHTSVALSFALADLGHDVIVIEVDAGLHNMDLTSGIDSSPFSIDDIGVQGGVAWSDAASRHPGFNAGNLWFLFSSWGPRIDMDLMRNNMVRLVSQASRCASVVILDAPAGIESNVKACISAADEVYVVTSQEDATIRGSHAVLVECGHQQKPATVCLNRYVNGKGFRTLEEVAGTLGKPILPEAILPFDNAIMARSYSSKPLPLPGTREFAIMPYMKAVYHLAKTRFGSARHLSQKTG